MRDPDFPQELCAFMAHCTPSLEAVELLLLLARNPGRGWTAPELAAALRPSVINEATIRDHLSVFAQHSLVERREDGAFAYVMPAQAIRDIVDALAKAYNERPVSLVRMIYQLKDTKIRSFADAFKIRKK